MATNEHVKIKQMHDENMAKLPEKPALGPIPIWVLSDAEVIDEWNKAILELSQKEEKLIHVKQDYSQKEFDIKYVEDIDFKELYGRANDDTRNQHVKITLKKLIDEKNELELRIDYLKRRISFLKL